MSDTVLLHLSDLHLKKDDRLLRTRANDIVAAVRAEITAVKDLIVVITGDVAYSGAATEYDNALGLFRSLTTLLQDNFPGVRIQYVAIPGNHDCDFGVPSELRDLTIDNIASRLDSLSADGTIVAECLSVQQEFFKFVELLTGHAIPSSDRLYYEREFIIDGRIIRFQCHNTAWVSRLHETLGQLVYPVAFASSTNSPSRSVAAAVSLLHHPFSWFQPANRRSVIELLERTSDVILTGHEHVADSYRRLSQTRSSCDYLEGGVLHESDDPDMSEAWLSTLTSLQTSVACD